jgi:hypothetical protein
MGACARAGRPPMNINTSATAQITDSIQRMNDMLKISTEMQLGLENKMMKADVIAQEEGKGENLDVSA